MANVDRFVNYRNHAWSSSSHTRDRETEEKTGDTKGFYIIDK
jgi:hypothetical protein